MLSNYKRGHFRQHISGLAAELCKCTFVTSSFIMLDGSFERKNSNENKNVMENL